MALRQHVGFHHTQQGTTLIEQIMVLAIIGILISVAAPSLGKLLIRNQQQIAQADLISALRANAPCFALLAMEAVAATIFTGKTAGCCSRTPIARINPCTDRCTPGAAIAEN